MQFSMNTDRLYEDHRGVTPVIGTILVVAIVVILAAVVGTYAFDLSQDVNEAPAQAVLDLEFEEAERTDPDGGFNRFLWQIKLTHTGGEDVDGEDIMIYFNHGPVQLTGEYNGTLTSGDSVEVAIVHTGGYYNESKYDCGDENVACSLAGDADEGHYPDEDHVDLMMVHEPSNTILYEEEIKISGDYGIYTDEADRSDDELTFS